MKKGKTSTEELTSGLRPHLPEGAFPQAVALMQEYPARFRISRPRKSKYGDYRPPFRGQPHRISVNGNLNPYLFLLTMVHEYAHLVTWQQHQRQVRPHGPEWKGHFQRLMEPFLNREVFPQEVLHVLRSYLGNPAAASCTDLELHRLLRQYDRHEAPRPLLEEIPDQSYFEWRDGRVFQKQQKLRKRFRCVELETQRLYLFSPLAEVKVLEERK